MALPNLSAADLEKLKLFINFVSENPTVLNLPQLKFVKDFVEKLGGKVPEGEFKMPAGGVGGKCPFGGNASGASDATSGMNIDDSEESDLDESEPESEVELDMEANTLFSRNKLEKRSAWSRPITVQDTSTVYLEESKDFRKKRHIKAESEQVQDDDDEYECHVEAGTEAEDSINEEDDPIKTNVASVEMKSEVDSDFDIDDVLDENYKNEDEEAEDENVDEGSDSAESDYRKPKRTIITRSSKRVKPLNKGRKAKRKEISLKKRNIFKELKYAKKIRKPKPVRCAGKCKKQCGKIDDNQRMKLCQEFWALNYVDRKTYLLRCIERKPLGKMRVKKQVQLERKLTNTYYLTTSDGDRVRVCLPFFLKTLSTSSYLIKDAIQNSDGKGNYTGIDLRGGSGEGRRCKLKHLKNQTKRNLNDEGTRLKDSENEYTKNELPTENKTVLEGTKHSEAKQAETSKQNEIAVAEGNATTEDNLNIIKSNISADINDKIVGKTIVQSKDPAETTVAALREKRKKPVEKRKRGTPIDHVPRPVNCEKICKFECHTKFTEERRVLLCAAFWRLSYKRRKDFVLAHVEVHENLYTTAAEYRKTDRVRTYTNRFFLRGEHGENVRVCSRFFYATLCVGRDYLVNAQKHVDKQTGAYAGEDGRRKSTKWNKTSDALICSVHEHIKSYPTWVPHKNYNTRFLHSSLNIKKMYNEYKEECERQKKEMVSCTLFRKIFHKDFKLAFLQPTSKHAHKVSSNKKCVNVEEPNTNTGTVTNNIQANSVLLKSSIYSSSITTAAVPITSGTEPSASKKKKGVNPNISIFTGEEGGFWSQLTPNASETMRFLQQRYAPQSSSSSSAPVITPTYQQQQQQQHQQQSQQRQQQEQQHTSHTLAQQQQQLLPQQQQLLIQPAHLAQPTVSQLHSTSIYQLPPQVVTYMHQPHNLNVSGSYENEQRVQHFHML